MDGYRPMARVSELAPGEMKRVVVAGQRVLLANVDGAFHALRDRCGHQNAPLSKGKLAGDVVECPLHFARFDVRTGKALSSPDFSRVARPPVENPRPEALAAMQRAMEIVGEIELDDVPAYAVRVEGDSVLVRV